jgi:hypothetical protein
MFTKVGRKLAGVVSLDDLIKSSESVIRSIINSPEKENEVELGVLKDADWFAAWREQHNELLKPIADVNSRHEQMLAIRKATMQAVDHAASAKSFLSDGWREGEKRTLSSAMHPDLPFEEAMRLHFKLYVVSQASCRCFRSLSLQLGDARANGWFTMYVDLVTQLIQHLHHTTIADADDRVYACSPLVPVIRQAIEDARREILQGVDWNYDKEEMKREAEEQEADSKEQEPPKVRDIRSHHIEELTAFLTERLRRMVEHGELYNVNGRRPSQPTKILSVESGLMLIALSECVTDRQMAIDAVRDIVWRTLNVLAAQSMEGKLPSAISLTEQIDLLSIWEKNRDEGPLGIMCYVIAHLLFGIEVKEDDKEHKRGVSEFSVKLVDDAWCVYATTKNVFGWKLPLKTGFLK